jgi:hypothetical protein
MIDVSPNIFGQGVDRRITPVQILFHRFERDPIQVAVQFLPVRANIDPA